MRGGLLQYKLTAAGLYWAVKQLAKDMAAGKAGYKHLAESATAAAAADLPSLSDCKRQSAG
jgi:hypothetical protein